MAIEVKTCIDTGKDTKAIFYFKKNYLFFLYKLIVDIAKW